MYVCICVYRLKRPNRKQETDKSTRSAKHGEAPKRQNGEMAETDRTPRLHYPGNSPRFPETFGDFRKNKTSLLQVFAERRFLPQISAENRSKYPVLKSSLTGGGDWPSHADKKAPPPSEPKGPLRTKFG